MLRMTSRLPRLTLAAAITIPALLSLAARAQAVGQGAPLVKPVVWSLVATPIYPFKGADGRIHLAYELHVTNASQYRVRIKSIEVLDAGNNRVTGVSRVVSADGHDVTGKVRPFALPDPTQDAVDYTERLGPGQGGVVYFDVTYGAMDAVPRRLKHRFVVASYVPDQDPQIITTTDEGANVSRQEALVITPPLRGANWVDVNGSGRIIGSHRYNILPTNGALRPMERYAIDFMRLDAQGHACVGDPKDLKNWFYYGSDIVSATYGKVVAAVDRFVDQIPGEDPASMPPDEIAGNHVVVAIGDGKYAFYAHMAPGSIIVHTGDAVQPGQKLGQLGNTGNTDGPHLHFEIMDSPFVLNTISLPFVVDRMTYQGQVQGTLDSAQDALLGCQAGAIDPGGAGRRTRELPLSLDVIGFR